MVRDTRIDLDLRGRAVLNVGEPDWASVGKALLKVLAVTAVLCLSFRVVDKVAWLFIDDDERMARVYATTARVANPDKRLSYGQSEWGGLLESTYTLQGEPRRIGPSKGETEYQITENVFGAVRAPSLDGPSGSLGTAIDAMYLDEDDAVFDGLRAEKARKAMDGLPQSLEAVAVVEFKDAMTTERLVGFQHRHKICGGEDLSYLYYPSYYDDSADPPSQNAVVWNRGMAKEPSWQDLTYQCASEPYVALTEFRRWVGLLDEKDDFEAFGLTYGWLTEAAEDGLVYGLVVDGWQVADLRKLLDDPEVRIVHLADVAFDLG
ncbi:hypothetical protein [Nonomuraea insulae]|uniref:Sigma factor regulator C-terminal domain-containing protein n=1 Tax=Nonomuraea insulae TaxID=1616787 RepID=A0ABW1D7E6_9ACTN